MSYYKCMHFTCFIRTDSLKLPSLNVFLGIIPYQNMTSKSIQRKSENELSPEWTFKAKKTDGTAVQISQDLIGEPGLLSKNSISKKLKAAGYQVKQIEVNPPSSIEVTLL